MLADADKLRLARTAVTALTSAAPERIAVLREKGGLPKSPGLYALHCSDPTALASLGRELSAALEPGLVYVGDTRCRAMANGQYSSGTLRKRPLNQHFGGNASASTVRRTAGSLLPRELELQPCRSESGRVCFAKESEARLSAWMRQHLLVTFWPAPSSQALVGLEELVLAALRPPLDLHKAAASPFRERISELRKRLRELGADQPCS